MRFHFRYQAVKNSVWPRNIFHRKIGRLSARNCIRQNRRERLPCTEHERTGNCMTVTANELARRLRAARQALSMTQREAAQYVSKSLGKPISRPAIAQMETGRRTVSLRELQYLARAYGRDMREFLSDSFQTEDTLSVLLRTHPESLSRSLLPALRPALAVGRELSNLEKLLQSSSL